MSSQDSTTRQTVNNLVRGLITESSDLTFPEGATIDELNFDLDITGIRTRRKGVDVEKDASFTTGNGGPNEIFRTFIWERVGDIPELEFVVTQTGARVLFYERTASEVSGKLQDFRINLNLWIAKGSPHKPSEYPIDVCSIQGWLIISNRATQTLLVKYDREAGGITVEPIDFRVRDFTRLYTADDDFERRPDAIDVRYRYDLLNMGWDNEKISAFKSKLGVFPPRNLAWWGSKDKNGEFNPVAYNRVYAGSSFAGNGHYVLDLFNKDRSSVSGVNGISPRKEEEQFTTNIVYGGRVFYSGISSGSKSSRLYFSKTIINENDLGILHQVGDPASETTPDIVATDGGVINIGEADTIKALFVYGNSLLIFASNGIWMLSGPDGFFTAESFVIDKISDQGITSRDSLVNVEGIPVWWGRSAIYSVERNDINNRPIIQNISRTTIQTFYDSINLLARENCVAVYDKTDRVIYWMYSSNPDSFFDCKFDKMLCFHAGLQAFYPRDIYGSEGGYHVVGGFFNYPNTVAFTEKQVVVGDEIVLADTDLVKVNVFDNVSVQDSSAQIRLTILTPEGLTYGGFENNDFKDFGQWDAEAYFETGYNFVGDLWQDKYLDAVVCYYNLTETGVDENFVPVNQSSAKMQIKWDGATSSFTNKWSRQYQTYRIQRMPLPSEPSSDVDFGYDRVKTINRVRGSGDSIRMRFSTDEGKDLQFQGYEMVAAKGKIYV